MLKDAKRRPGYGRQMGLALCAIAASGCTHLETSPDRLVTDQSYALPGATYALPMLQYEVAVSRTLAGCPTQITLDEDRGPEPYWSDSLSIELAATATPYQIEGERYRVDYTQLDSWFKTTAFTIEYQPGTELLKSVNVAVEDHTGEVIGNVVKAGLAAATVVAGPAGAATTAAAAPAITTLGIQKSTLKGLRDERQEARAKLLALIGGSIEQRPLVTCTEDAKAAVAKRNALAESLEDSEEKLDSLTREVDAFTDLATIRALNKKQRENFVDKVKELLALTTEIETQKAEMEDFAGALGVTATVRWPERFDQVKLEDAAALTDGQKAKLVGFLEPTAVTVQVIRADLLAQKLAGSSDSDFALFKKHYGKFVALYVTDGGAPRYVKPRGPVTGCSPAQVDPNTCVASLTAMNAALKAVKTDTLPDCPDDATGEGECVLKYPTATSDTQKGWLPAQTSARSNTPSKGLFVRPPARATLLVCRKASAAEIPSSPADPKPECAPGTKDLIKDDTVLAPQLGQLRFFPLTNEVFSNNALTLSLTKEGAIEKFSYSTSKSVAQGMTAAAADAATQAMEFDKARRAEAEANSDPVAKLQKEIDLKEAEAKLKALNAPPAADAEQKAETARLQAEVDYLNARKSLIEAQRALAAVEVAEPE